MYGELKLSGASKTSRHGRRATASDSESPNLVRALKMAAAVIEIVSDYDVRHMTPIQMMEMSRRLYDAGAISTVEFGVLSFRSVLAGRIHLWTPAYQTMQAEPDHARDFVEAWQRHYDQVCQSSAEPPQRNLVREVLDLLMSFQPLLR